jgi:hypothetical protein
MRSIDRNVVMRRITVHDTTVGNEEVTTMKNEPATTSRAEPGYNNIGLCGASYIP